MLMGMDRGWHENQMRMKLPATSKVQIQVTHPNPVILFNSTWPAAAVGRPLRIEMFRMDHRLIRPLAAHQRFSERELAEESRE
jgi:hypothetical protein